MKETTVFKNGASQAVRIPQEMRFASDSIYIAKVGNIAVLLDKSDPWASLRLAQLLFAGQFMNDGRSVNEIVERKGLNGEK